VRRRGRGRQGRRTADEARLAPWSRVGRRGRCRRQRALDRRDRVVCGRGRIVPRVGLACVGAVSGVGQFASRLGHGRGQAARQTRSASARFSTARDAPAARAGILVRVKGRGRVVDFRLPARRGFTPLAPPTVDQAAGKQQKEDCDAAGSTSSDGGDGRSRRCGKGCAGATAGGHALLSRSGARTAADSCDPGRDGGTRRAIDDCSICRRRDCRCRRRDRGRGRGSRRCPVRTLGSRGI
jgi:hypothetical protein